MLKRLNDFLSAIYRSCDAFGVESVHLYYTDTAFPLLGRKSSASARKLAEKEEIEIRLYSIIYDAINDIKDAIEGMLEPVMKEEIVASVEVLEIFKISKVGTVAGCVVREGKLQRNTPIRVIRDGIVIYTGKLGSLKRFKDDVKEVTVGQDCGLNIESFNDIRIGDIVEGYEQVEVKRK